MGQPLQIKNRVSVFGSFLPNLANYLQMLCHTFLRLGRWLLILQLGGLSLMTKSSYLTFWEQLLSVLPPLFNTTCLIKSSQNMNIPLFVKTCISCLRNGSSQRCHLYLGKFCLMYSFVFATDHGEHTESALPLLNLLDVLTVHNVYRFHILKFTYLWHKGLLPKPFSNYFQYASNVHKYNTRYASKQNLYVKKVRTNMGKQTIGYAACVIWDEIPLKLKELSVYQFSKQLKPYLLSEQHN